MHDSPHHRAWSEAWGARVMEGEMTIGESVEHYVDSLCGANADDAWHALVELGPSALPHVIAAFHTTSHLDTQVSVGASDRGIPNG